MKNSLKKIKAKIVAKDDHRLRFQKVFSGVIFFECEFCHTTFIYLTIPHKYEAYDIELNCVPCAELQVKRVLEE